MSHTQSRNFLTSLGNAWEGLMYALRSQRNLRIHIAAGITAVVAAVAMEFSRMELALVVLAVCLVILGEMLNTALEFALNLLEARHHPVVRAAKDLAAAGVLTAVIGSVIVGAILFGPRLWWMLWGLR
ncbi:MAG: diacylglycerol kinase family protein [Candidatus Omnitrophica bacterium]|nr:diacylglycerol kinase family protein [Candidatus Omnitrophota bacterium]